MSVEPIIPIWKKLDEETGDWVFGLHPADMELVAQRYACHNCLEQFYVGGMRVQLMKCPVCRRDQDRASDYGIIVPTPASGVDASQRRVETQVVTSSAEGAGP